MSFSPDQIAYVDIYPPINIARVGDSSEHFIGTEIPGVEPIPEGGFKDKDQKIKKQAARFRVYAFDKDSKPLGEVTSKEYDLTWTCHVASKKAAWVIFRGKYRKETWQLRNKTVQGWPSGQPPNYEYTNTRTKLIIDSGKQTIEGENTQPVALQGEFQGSLDKAIPVQLGELRTDDHGRLLVLASDGHSFSAIPPADQDLHSGFDNDGWVDKMCDGSVRVTVKSKSQPDLKIPTKNRATVMTAPPRFASGTHIPTTLYELIEDIYEQSRRGKNYDVGEVVYYRDIYPLFKRIYLLSWTNAHALRGHGAANMDYFENPDLSDPTVNNKARKKLFQKMRCYVLDGDAENERIRDGQASFDYMPRLGGDDGDCKPGLRDRWASLTRLQYERMQKWSEGKFTTGEPEVPYESFDKIPLAQQPDALTRSALEWSIGAPLYPGIECFWIAQASKMYNLREKFRFADIVTPGDLGKGLSLPWQSDFNMCADHWWPSIRPDDVVTEEYFEKVKSTVPPDQLASNLKQRFAWDEGLGNDNSEMVRKWNKLGFVARENYGASSDQPEILIERQRDLPRSQPA